MTNQQKGKDLLIGAVVGGVLGAVTALLLAPKSGKELRGDIAGQAQAVSEKTQQIAGAISQKTQDVAKTIGTHTGEWYDKTKEAALTAVQEVRSWRESDKQAAVDENLSEAAEDLVILGNR